jgi:flavodoxin
MRILVVYYSLSGTTRKLAEALANASGADIAEIRCPRYGRGISGFLMACYDSVMARLPDIETTATMRDYDLVLAGVPVWAGHIATPMRAFLGQGRGQSKRIAFFLTNAGSATERPFAEMGEIAGVRPEATLALRTGDILDDRYAAAVDTFVQSFKLKAAA